MFTKFQKFEIKRKIEHTIKGGASSGQPGGSLNVLVRGQGSLSVNTPLYIVD